MKKVLLTSAAVLAVPALVNAEMTMSAPTIYGKINKSFAYTDQDVKTRKSTTGVRDVDNSETRLGAKGEVAVSEAVKANYALEIGFNSTESGSSRIRMRLAQGSFMTKLGTVTFGQTYTPSSAKALTLDPLSNTILGVANADQAKILGNIVGAGKKGGLGAIYRSRVDLLSYTTPVFGGLTYTISSDKSNKMANDSTDTNNYGPETFEHMVDFNHTMGDMKLNVFVNYQTTSSYSTKDDTVLFYGAKLSMNAFDFAVSMTSEEVEANNTKTEVERMIGAVTYKMNAHKVAFTYQTAEQKKSNETTQMALGYKYALDKNIELRGLVGTYEFKDKVTSTNKNDATIFGLGTEIKF
ncbi:general bacterial porin family protein [Bacteriovorax sp. BSW11_IV]|uniref:porin n=1 Tax=Bacteriovorax sp. BSW11_IV TaxID=1353529 RepID=UPI00038A299B|nr:porin [Bacteriovorax sp. BSW11_IV]EQC49368.1 general bacterial porin family protein [Bacteriovorax sp. BSW11_IV]